MRLIETRSAPRAAVRCCADCPTLVFGRKQICEPCHKQRERKRAKTYHATPGARARKLLTDAKYRTQRRDQKNKSNRDYRARNPEASRASTKKWQLAHVEERRAYVEKNRVKIAAKDRLRRQKNRRIAAALRPPVIRLAFPYVTTSRPETLDYLALNALVPQGLPGREDAVQDMALAVLEGRTTLAALQSDRSLVRAFCRGHIKGNFEAGGYAVSLSQPRPDGRLWDDVLSDDTGRAWA